MQPLSSIVTVVVVKASQTQVVECHVVTSISVVVIVVHRSSWMVVVMVVEMKLSFSRRGKFDGGGYGSGNEVIVQS